MAVLLRTSEYRGDHSADVTEHHELLPGETVKELAERLLARNEDRHDWIEIRLVKAPGARS